MYILLSLYEDDEGYVGIHDVLAVSANESTLLSMVGHHQLLTEEEFLANELYTLKGWEARAVVYRSEV